MKKLYNKIQLLLILIPLFSVFNASAQDYFISNGTANGCNGQFYDSGLHGNYSDNEDLTYTIFPIGGGYVYVDFFFFETEENYDGLMIYDGPDVNAPLISSGAPAGNNPYTCPAESWRGVLAPFSVYSTHATGALTFVFKSDGSVNKAGWAGNVHCSDNYFFVNGPLPVFCVNASANIDYSSNYTFNAGNIFTVELSDALGDFSSPTVIGTLAGTSSNGSIPVNIPALPQSLGYRVRILASDTAVSTADVAYQPYYLDPIVSHYYYSDCFNLDYINEGRVGDNSPYLFDLNNYVNQYSFEWFDGFNVSLGNTLDPIYSAGFNGDFDLYSVVTIDPTISNCFSAASYTSLSTYIPDFFFDECIECGTNCPIECNAVGPVNDTLTACSGNFYDSDGDGSNYCNYEEITTVIYPANVGEFVQMNFNYLDIEENYDFLSIYDGEDASAPLLGTFSGNTNPGSFTASNPAGALTTVFTSDYAVVHPGWDATITCVPCVVYVPDQIFLSALLSNPYINTNSNNVIECDEASSFTGDIGVAWLGITDMTGIEAFVNLNSLICEGNYITDLDLSNNNTLTYLNCQYNQLINLQVNSPNLNTISCNDNQLTTLDLSNAPNLQYLYAYYNFITSLDLSSNQLLYEVSVGSNQLTSINTTGLADLSYLSCHTNLLSSIDVSTNINLFSLDCSYNQLSLLDVSNNVILYTLYCHNNQLSNINTQNAANLYDFYCPTNLLTTLDLSSNANLTYLNCSVNQITSLDLSANVNLFYLECGQNLLTTLDLSANPNLQYFYCNSNLLTTLNVSGCPLLYDFQCNENQLTTIDVTNNPAIYYFFCEANLLSSLDLSNNIDLYALTCGFNSISVFDFSNNPNLTHLTCNNNLLTDLDLSANSNMFYLECRSNLLATINVNNLTNLHYFIAEFNQLTDLNFNSNTSLISFAIRDNNLNNLSIKNNNVYNFDYFDATFNPGLTCISVDDVLYMNTFFNTGKDAAAIFSMDCSRPNINMTNGSTNACHAFFHDSGGDLVNYNDNENSVFTINPDVPGNMVSITFLNLDLAVGDTLKIYNGTSTASNLLGRYTSLSPSFPINSSDASGALTFEFTSDFINVGSGWLAEINCDPTFSAPACPAFLTPADNQTNVPIDATFEWVTDIGSGSDSYALSIGTSPNPTLTSNLNVPYFDNGLLLPNTTYYWTVDLSNSAGNQTGCLEQTFTTGYVVDACDANASTGDGGIIGNVEISYIGYSHPTGGAINSNDLTGYSDYTYLTPIDIGLGLSYLITVTNDDPETDSGCGIYIDWNQDGDFYDVDEFITVNGNYGPGPYTAVISPPSGTLPGYVRMRVRLSINYYINPCGDDFFGEVEDYVLNLHPTCIVNIPDPNFKNYLINNFSINTNGDGEIECAEAAAFTGSIIANNMGIIDMTGIEAFVQLSTLECTGNSISTLDLSANANLTYLACYDNQISNLNVSGISNIEILKCENNQLLNLDVTSHSGLQYLYFNNNLISNIDLSGNPNLMGLGCEENQLTGLDLSNNAGIGFLIASDNQIPVLDASGLGNLDYLELNNNQLIDLNIQNGNNTNLIQFSALNNPSLTCIRVDNPVFMDSNWSGGKDVTATYGLSCSLLPDFAADDTLTCLGNNITFSDSTTGVTGSTVYFWDFGAGANPATANTAGPHTVFYTTPGFKNVSLTLTDGISVSETKNNYIEIKSPPTLNTAVTQETCSAANGSIDLTVSGGTGTSTFVWSNGALTEDISGLAANTYNVTVNDSLGCFAVTSETITNAPTATLGTTQVNETCSTTNGSIDLTVTGGTAPFNFVWDNGAITEDIAGLAANTYNVVVTDFNGCVANASATITNAPTATLSTSQVDETCSASNGSIDLTVTGGTAPFTFAWDNGAITEDINGLTANTYNVVVTDFNGCVANAAATLNNTPGITLSTTTINETCSASNGSIDLTVAGGTAPFTFAWDNGAITEDNAGLIANTYNVVVTDFNGCVANASATITNAPTATLSTSQVDETCSASNGSIDLIVTGGTAPFTFAWDNGAITEDIGGLAANTYNVVVTDFNGCVANASATITNVPTATLSTTQVNETCSASNGSIDLTITGGTAPFTYAWDNGAITEDIGGLAANTYNVVVTDFNGCVANASATITNVPTATLSTTQVNETCSASNGSIDLTVTGGTAPFTFAWDNGAITEDISGLAANTYNVVVTDFNGCVANTSATITNAPAATLSTTQVDETCSASNGSIDLTVTGGTAPFTFAWDNGAITEDIAGLVANTYNVVVTDFNGCVANASATITNAPTATLSTTQGNETCSASNGSIDLTVTGGTAPFTYAWDNGAITEDIAGLVANTYNVVVTDFNGCVANASATITNAPTATLSTTQVNETCSASNGSIDLTVTGGTAPFTYAWDNGAITEDINGLTANTYNVVVTDFNGCVANASATITNAPTATLSTTQVNETCSASNGSIDLTVTGGTAPFTYAWDNGAITEDIAGLAANTYNVVVTDFNGCVANASATITNAPTATLSTTQVNETCSASNGSIDLTVTGGTSPFTYAWDNGAITEDIAGLAANTYNVVVTDFNGCVANTSATITNAPTATLSTTQVDETCSASNGSIDLIVTGGTAPFTFAWDNGAITEDIGGLVANTYNVVVTDFNGCVANASATITNAPTATLSTTQVNETCSASNGSIDLTVTGGTAPFTFAWDNGAITEDINGLAANTYNVVVTDFNGCVANATATITNAPTATLSTTQVNETCSASNGSIDLTVTGGTAPFTFAWDNGAITEDINGLVPNTYNVVVTDFNGCVANTSATITNAPTATLSTTQVNETCSVSNGSIDLTVTGGTAPFTFAWDNGAITEDINGLAANTYNVVVTDFNGCVANASATITNAPTATLSTTQVNETCSASNGSIDLTVTGGTAPFTFAWDNGAITEDISALAPNTYNVVVTDFNGCVANTSATILSIGGPTSVSLNTYFETCTAANGSVKVTGVGGGTPAFNYSLDGITYAATDSIFGLSANNYTIYVQDANLCVFTQAFVISDLAGPSAATLNLYDETCGASNGAFQVTSVTGNAAPYLYSIDGITYTAIDTLSGLSAQAYNLFIQDTNNCVFAQPFTINNIAGPSGTISVIIDETCTAGNGVLDINGITGGTAPYLYSLDGVTYAANDSLTAFAAGNYTLYVTDVNNCLYTEPFVINNLAGPTALNYNLQIAACGLNVGVIDITSVTGGNAPFTYSTDGVTYAANDSITGLAGGAYNIFVSDSNNCIYSEPFNIASTPAAVATASNDTTICFGATATLIANGGTLYSWDNGAGNTASVSVSPASSTLYTVTVTDANNCSATEQVQVNVNAIPAVPVITANGPLTFCQGNTVTLYSSYIGGNTWSGGTTLDSLQVASGGSVILTFTDVNGCSSEDSVSIIVNPLPVVNLSGPVYVCEGTAAIGLTGGTPAGGTYSGTGVSGGNFDPLLTGAGTFDFYYSFTDANTCVNSDTAQIVVNAKPVLSLSSDSLFFCTGNDAAVLSEVSPSGGTYSGTGISNNAFAPAVAGEGIFTLNYAYTDVNGCINDIDLIAQVGTLEVIMPNLFTGIKGEAIQVNAATNYFRSGGVTFTYNWEPATLFSDPSASTPLVTTVTDTTIQVTISDGYCSASSSSKVLVVEPEVTVILATSNPGTGLYDILVDNGNDYRELLIDVYNIMGAKTNSYTFNIVPGKNIIPFNLHLENDGTYVLLIKIGNVEKAIKIVKAEK